MKDGGYRGLKRLAAGLAPKDLQRLVTGGITRQGRGGFPTGTKWSFVPDGPRRAETKIYRGHRR
ncbi:MAG: hypothetical protein U0236_21765 [Nitrospira sp.]